ncbi:MAG: phage terminase large subunit family protein [Clostridia bacterium]|nr:phage terminase large subunit family protein [Clostridia bacterium]
MTSSEKVAYLRGLMEGLDLKEDDKYAKLFNAVIDTLDELASDVADISEDYVDLTEYVEELDEDLGFVEDMVYGDDDECCDCDCCDDDCECCDDDDFIEVECPACGEQICIDFDAIDEEGQVECPNCGELLEFDIEEGCDCDCCQEEE